MKQETTTYEIVENGLIKEEIKISEHVVPEEIKVTFIDRASFAREIEQLERTKSDLIIRRDEIIASYVNPIDQINTQIDEIQSVINGKKAKVEAIKKEVPEIADILVGEAKEETHLDEIVAEEEVTPVK